MQCLESFEMWCRRKMEKNIWTDRVRKEELLHRVKEDRNILHAINRRKANWVGHILSRNCLLKHNRVRVKDRSDGSQGKDVSSYWMILRKIEDTGS
jgi:hypothetical protein